MRSSSSNLRPQSTSIILYHHSPKLFSSFFFHFYFFLIRLSGFKIILNMEFSVNLFVVSLKNTNYFTIHIHTTINKQNPSKVFFFSSLLRSKLKNTFRRG